MDDAIVDASLSICQCPSIIRASRSAHHRISLFFLICRDVAVLENVAAACCGTYGPKGRPWLSACMGLLPAAVTAAEVGAEGIRWAPALERRSPGRRFASRDCITLKQLAVGSASSWVNWGLCIVWNESLLAGFYRLTFDV